MAARHRETLGRGLRAARHVRVVDGGGRWRHRAPCASRSTRWMPTIGVRPASRLVSGEHTGATSGPRITRPQRTTPVTVGPSSAQFIGQTASIAGGRDHPGLPDTEEVASPLRPGQRLRGLPRLKWPGHQALTPWRTPLEGIGGKSVLRWGGVPGHAWGMLQGTAPVNHGHSQTPRHGDSPGRTPLAWSRSSALLSMACKWSHTYGSMRGHF
jgi:hypothetical protein